MVASAECSRARTRVLGHVSSRVKVPPVLLRNWASSLAVCACAGCEPPGARAREPWCFSFAPSMSSSSEERPTRQVRTRVNACGCVRVRRATAARVLRLTPVPQTLPPKRGFDSVLRRRPNASAGRLELQTRAEPNVRRVSLSCALAFRYTDAARVAYTDWAAAHASPVHRG